MELEKRYQQIQESFERLPDFPIESLSVSRNLFYLGTKEVIPKRFEVWTLVAGLPLPESLTQNFQAVIDRIIEKFPANTRFYKVLPQNYHWELFIIKRPDENVTAEHIQKTPEVLRDVLGNHSPLTITYQGFLITIDGTIIVKGYGDFDRLRGQLREKFPWASLRQSNLGHISLGRLLDPVGESYFTQLKDLVHSSETEFYGKLEVSEVKYVHESQWYMEEREVVAVLQLGTL